MDFSGSGASVVRCHGCTNWIRLYATECASTCIGDENYSLQRWCFACLAEIDEATAEAMKGFAEYPEGLSPWDKDDEDESSPEDPTDSGDENTDTGENT